MKLETKSGEREIWGVDLERALKESLSKPQLGDQVGLRAVRQDPVTVKARERDAKGDVIRQRNSPRTETRWIVAKQEFYNC